MQGRKDYQEQLFVGFQLSNHVPKTNFYRRLLETLDLEYIRPITKNYYGKSGQKSVDPVVFFKLNLVAFLENIDSDRRLIDHCSMRMDILYFLGYNIDEPLPWHSTLSRTRQLLPNSVFEEVFNQVFTICVEKGLVSGHTQVIDSAPVKANASMDSLELKVPPQELDSFLAKARNLGKTDKPRRKAKENKASDTDKTITADKRTLQEIKARNKNWDSKQKRRPGAGNKNSKYTSNKTHYSPVDPDARISVKPGKARKLNFSSQLGVDPSKHIISHIGAHHADKKDSQYLIGITEKLDKRLKDNGLIWKTLPADAGYSSGEVYAYLEQKGITSYIPPHGTYKGGPVGFEYIKDGDYWLCPNNKKVTFRKVQVEKDGNKKRRYLTKTSDCKGCPFKHECAPKSPEKRIDITYYRDEYERAIARVNSKHGRRMKKLRQSTVEPVFGILTQFMGMRKVYTRGIDLANKKMLMAATAYNLKKIMKYSVKKRASQANAKANEAKNNLKNSFEILFLIIMNKITPMAF
jgi:transposase